MSTHNQHNVNTQTNTNVNNKPQTTQQPSQQQPTNQQHNNTTSPPRPRLDYGDTMTSNTAHTHTHTHAHTHSSEQHRRGYRHTTHTHHTHLVGEACGRFLGGIIFDNSQQFDCGGARVTVDGDVGCLDQSQTTMVAVNLHAHGLHGDGTESPGLAAYVIVCLFVLLGSLRSVSSRCCSVFVIEASVLPFFFLRDYCLDGTRSRVCSGRILCVRV